MKPYATSMQLDAAAGRPLEHEAIVGAPLRAATAAGLPLRRIGELYDALCRLDGELRQGKGRGAAPGRAAPLARVQ